MRRREFLQLGVASALGGWLSGCARCDAGFPPNMTMPVFYGYKDYFYTPPVISRAKGAGGVYTPNSIPMARVFYPSIAGTPAGAPILRNCEPFPLVLLIHGDCPGDPYIQWYFFAGELARAGYVVAITYAGGVLATGDPVADTQSQQGVYNYMRNNWEYRDTLMAAPNTAVIGHSFGGTLAAELTTQIPNKAFVSLSGAFGQITPVTAARGVLSALRGPCLFQWNVQGLEDGLTDSIMFVPGQSLAGSMWSLVAAAPKHGVVFTGGDHADYLMPGTTALPCDQGGCNNRVMSMSADLATTFLTKYMPPGGLTGIAGLVPDSLVVRPQDFAPPPDGGFYAGGMLFGLASSAQSSSQPNSAKQPCFEQVFWQTGSSLQSIYTYPSYT